MRIPGPLFIGLLLLSLPACEPGSESNSDRVLARVYDQYLYESELENVVSPGTGVKDSILLVKNFINNWIKDQLVLEAAQKNLPREEMDFRQKLEDYRNSLIIYRYESKLVSQNLDTVVKQSDIEDYFERNNENFRLKTNIVRAIYGRFMINDPRNDKLSRFFRSGQPQAMDSLEFYFINFAESYSLSDEKWIPFDELLRIIPIQTNNKEGFLKNNKKVIVEDDLYKYYVIISDYKLVDEIAPLAFERENIRQIIINGRRLQLIRAMHKEVFENALENNDFEIY